MSFIYRRVSKMLSMCAQGGGIKEILHKKEDKSIKKIYFLLHKALEDLDILNRVYTKYLSEICKNKFLGIVLLCVLVQRKKIDGGGKLKKEIMKREKEILHFYNTLKEKEEKKNCTRQILKIKKLKKYFIIYDQDEKKNDILEKLRTLFPVEEDEDVENLYEIESDKVGALVSTTTYKENKIRIIDKTSCLVVQAGEIKEGMVIVDVCSAPGSKAILSLMLLKEKGYLICIEKNKKRCFTLLQEILKQNHDYGGIYLDESFTDCKKFDFNEQNFFINYKDTHVYYIKHRYNDILMKIYNADFFHLSEEDFSSFGKIDVVFVDPSCSSSGMPDFVHKHRMQQIFGNSFESGEGDGEGLVSGKGDNEEMASWKGDIEELVSGKGDNEEMASWKGDIEELVSGKGDNEEMASWNVDTRGMASKQEDLNPISNFLEQVAEGRIPRVPRPFQEKVKNLAKFQTKILNHALDTLKIAKTFIYSTCSFFEEENEHVIESVLQSNPNFSLEKAGKEKFLFTSGTSAVSRKCVRTFPAQHSCRGIFISKLLRSSGGLEQEPC
ncbi:S-adenosyl-L-methionine-dependent methyltransferase [Plasmodium gonderi]|uniref:S-adenosyl-L-methionine-dependent methyltransferase n=1 Tax=Plasmodium gonderi TaxID=77519 RepID=A0A1Y1JBP1_PLAGO|nr:S-adenosyl-L-methionine-dependent methyltransferase [Plasmodium gonderi]GAW79906.1 S-adenosyl-L-methionine-dependent methyltransferase [Plasmodium gonderi]